MAKFTNRIVVSFFIFLIVFSLALFIFRSRTKVIFRQKLSSYEEVVITFEPESYISLSIMGDNPGVCKYYVTSVDQNKRMHIEAAGDLMPGPMEMPEIAVISNSKDLLTIIDKRRDWQWKFVRDEKREWPSWSFCSIS